MCLFLQKKHAVSIMFDVTYIENEVTRITTEKVTKSGSLLPLGKNSLLSKIGDQRCDRKFYLLSVSYLVNVRLK